jgi:hypothetical protein
VPVTDRGLSKKNGCGISAVSSPPNGFEARVAATPTVSARHTPTCTPASITNGALDVYVELSVPVSRKALSVEAASKFLDVACMPPFSEMVSGSRAAGVMGRCPGRLAAPDWAPGLAAGGGGACIFVDGCTVILSARIKPVLSPNRASRNSMRYQSPCRSSTLTVVPLSSVASGVLVASG